MNAEEMTRRLAELINLRRKVDLEIRRLLRLERLSRNPQHRRSRHDIPPCGTEAGYQRHRHRKETCEACTVAHREHERLRYLATKRGT